KCSLVRFMLSKYRDDEQSKTKYRFHNTSRDAENTALDNSSNYQTPNIGWGDSGRKLPYCLKTNGGPLTRLPLRATVTSTRSAILMKGMALFMPNSLRSNAMVPLISPEPIPLPETSRFNVSGLETPRMVNVPATSNVVGPVCVSLLDLNVPLPVFTLSA